MTGRRRRTRVPCRRVTARPATADIEAVADMLAAKNPAMVAESIGRDPAGYSATVELADLLAIPVSSAAGWRYDFPKDHPLYQAWANLNTCMTATWC